MGFGGNAIANIAQNSINISYSQIGINLAGKKATIEVTIYPDSTVEVEIGDEI